MLVTHPLKYDLVLPIFARATNMSAFLPTRTQVYDLYLPREGITKQGCYRAAQQPYTPTSKTCGGRIAKRRNQMITLNEWTHTKEQISQNKSSRINWKHMFGISLSKYIARERHAGKQSQQIIDEAKKMYGLKPEATRRLKISVCARFCEHNTATGKW